MGSMKRIAVYVYQNQKGGIADYALYCIKALLNITEEIYVVINGKTSEEELKNLNTTELKLYTKKIFYHYFLHTEKVI